MLRGALVPRRSLLPVAVDGERYLRFRCTQCGDCCRQHRAPITDADVRRLAEHTGRPPQSFLEWLGPDDIDMTGEPESFVTLREGRRLMTLAFEREGCVFLQNDTCSVHSARPSGCRAFPFMPELDDQKKIRRLSLLHESTCRYELDGSVEPSAVVDSYTTQTTELVAYVQRVGVWNRRQRLRRHLRRLPESQQAYLRFLGLERTA